MSHFILWGLAGIPTGYVMCIFINDIYNISNVTKYSIITTITCLAILRGYTGNDLVTNISQIFAKNV
jgi:hypothetical protein